MSEMQPPAEAATLDGWIAQVDALMGAGELLAAYDTARRGLAGHPEALALMTRAVLALCRADVTDQAEALYREWGLERSQDRDAMALAARIAKNRAGRAAGREGRDLYRRAAAAYKAVFDQFGGHYPAVNAATSFLLAGDADLAELMARRSIDAVVAEQASGTAERYYAYVTEAEARLVLGDVAAAERSMALAAATGFADLSARAATRRQLRLVCHARDLSEALLEAIAPPRVLHYVGHRALPGPQARFPAGLEAEARDDIGRALEGLVAGAAVGSLAAGADILFAEALLARGVELTVVLPAAEEAFLATSVAPSGARWVERYRACRDGAGRVVMAGDDDRIAHDTAFDYCSRVAMGLALLHARRIDAAPVQLALWDGVDHGQEVGTEADVRHWRAGGHECRVVPVRATGAPAAWQAPEADPFEQKVMATLFADSAGFSRLSEREIRQYHAEVTHRVAPVLDRFGAAVADRNSWGDGLFVQFHDVAAGADCALAIQETLDAGDGRFRLRMSLHAGPCFAYDDPIRGRRAYTGRHVTRAARLEPITPLGEVFVSEAVAALLALEAPARFACDYSGHRERAKGAGAERVFSLKRGMGRSLT